MKEQSDIYDLLNRLPLLSADKIGEKNRDFEEREFAILIGSSNHVVNFPK